MFARTKGTCGLGWTWIGALERVGSNANARLAAVLVLDGAVVARRALELWTFVDVLGLGTWLARTRLATVLVCVGAVEARMAHGFRALRAVRVGRIAHTIARLAAQLVSSSAEIAVFHLAFGFDAQKGGRRCLHSG